MESNNKPKSIDSYPTPIIIQTKNTNTGIDIKLVFKYFLFLKINKISPIVRKR